MALKAYVEVTAGVDLPARIDEYTRRWDWSPEGAGKLTIPVEAKQRLTLSMTPAELLQFHENNEAALAYAKELMNPGVCNWVRVEWVWL